MKTDNKDIGNSEVLANEKEGGEIIHFSSIFTLQLPRFWSMSDIYCAVKAIKTHLVNYREPTQEWPFHAPCTGVQRYNIKDHPHLLLVINSNLICLVPTHQDKIETKPNSSLRTHQIPGSPFTKLSFENIHSRVNSSNTEKGPSGERK